MNGRCGDDKRIGSFTCLNKNGGNQYRLCCKSYTMFPFVSNFTVDHLDKCMSDVHKPIVLRVKR